MAYYRTHQAAFALVPTHANNAPARQAFFLASAAYKTGAPEFDELLQKAERAADDVVLGREWIPALQAAHAQQDMMKTAVDAGAFDLALELAENGRRRTAALGANTKIKKSETSDLNKIYDNTQNLHLRSIARSLGDYSELERLIREQMVETEKHAKKAMEKLRQFGSAGMLTGLMKVQEGMHLPELAEAMARQGKMDEARQLLTRYQEGKKGERGQVVSMLNGFLSGARAAKDGMTFAEIWLASGEPDKALQALAPVEKGIQHFASIATKGATSEYVLMATGKYNAVKARCLWLLGRANEALKCHETALDALKHLPRTHPETIRERQQLLWGWMATGKQAEAQAAMPELAADQMTMVHNLLRFAGERQRMIYLQQADPFSLLVATGETSRLVETVLRLKGLVLDSVLEERRLAQQTGNAEAKELFSQLGTARQKLSDATLAGTPEAPTLRAEVEGLEFKLASLTSGTLGTRNALTVTLPMVQQVLSAEDALVEFIAYRHLAKPGQWETHYGAVVLRSAQQPAWVPLGAASPLDDAISGMLAQMNTEVTTNADTETQRQLQQLYQRLITPLEPHLNGVKRLIFSPDGGLGRLSFAPLLNSSNRFLAETWELSYVSTARDLLRESTTPGSGCEMLILADPDLDLPATQAGKARYAKASFLAFDRDALPQFESLPGTLTEMQALEQLAGGQGILVTALKGAAATESALAATSPSPTYLHFATHGTVLAPTSAVRSAAQREGFAAGAVTRGGPTPPDMMPPALADHPLQRSVLALAGANVTFAQWRSGFLPPASLDGVLSAEEVAVKDLGNTWLCVLSACETAAGAPLSGEGVIGMRRGFFLAGVDHLAMTFWSIADDATAELMVGFYTELARKAHPAAALHRVQRDALVRWRQEKGLTTAVFLAGPFALSTTGKLPAL